MKKILLTLTAAILTSCIYYSYTNGAYMNRQIDNSNIKKIPVMLTVGEKKIRAVIYENKTGRDVLSRLPYTITLNRYEMDYCGTLSEGLKYDEKDKHNGWKNGDIDLAGNYFSILFDGEEKSQSYTDMITFGRIEEDLSIVRGLEKTIKVTVTLAD